MAKGLSAFNVNDLPPMMPVTDRVSQRDAPGKKPVNGLLSAGGSVLSSKSSLATPDRLSDASENLASNKTVIHTHLTVRINSDPNHSTERNARKTVTFFHTKDGNPFAI